MSRPSWVSCLSSGTPWHRGAIVCPALCWAGPHSPPQGPEPGLGGLQPSGVRGCWSPHNSSSGHHSNGDGVPWLSQAPISIAWTSAMSLVLSPVTLWPCHGSGPYLELAHTSHTDLLGVQSKHGPNPSPCSLGSGKTPSNT